MTPIRTKIGPKGRVSRVVLQIILNRFNIPEPAAFVGPIKIDSTVTSEDKVHNTLVDLANHELQEKYEELEYR